MAGEWKLSTLGEIADASPHAFVDGPFGSNLPASCYTASGVPIIRGSNLSLGETRFRSDEFVFVSDETANRLQRSCCKPLDIIFTKKGTLGQTGIVPEKGRHHRYLLSGNQMKLTVDRAKADPLFVFYFVSSPPSRTKIVQDSEVTGVPKTNLTYLRTFPIPLPPLAEQKAIAGVLGALDDKIELNRRMNMTLEAMARALFQSWFVDFDPVRAKLDGRQPVGLDLETAALFPEHLTDGEHDKLPVGWRHAAIEEVCDLNSWTLGKNDELETLEYVEISEVSRGNIANIATYARGEEPSRARRRLRHGDTVLSTVRPDRGSYFLALNPPENRVASTGFAVLTPTKVPWSFVHAAMTQQEVSDHLGQMADGGAYPAVRPEVIGAMQIVIPNEPKILEAFHRTCTPLFELAEANRAQSRVLATLRDTLLPKLLSGEVRVKELA
jgi:type I restriction enzyme S subunit